MMDITLVPGQCFLIGTPLGPAKVVVVEVQGREVRVRIEAAPEIPIVRGDYPDRCVMAVDTSGHGEG